MRQYSKALRNQEFKKTLDAIQGIIKNVLNMFELVTGRQAVRMQNWRFEDGEHGVELEWKSPCAEPRQPLSELKAEAHTLTKVHPHGKERHDG